MWIFRRSNKNKGDEDYDALVHEYGRNSNSYKSPQAYQWWDESISKFEHGEWMSAYQLLFKYLLQPQSTVPNITWQKEGQLLTFSLTQGSAVITGTIKPEFIRVKCDISRVQHMSEPCMSLLLQANFGLKFSKYAVDDDCLRLIHESMPKHTSPYKLFFVLKEMALQADKSDDLLVNQFDEIDFLKSRPRRFNTPEILDKKYRFFQQLQTEYTAKRNEHEELFNKYPGIAQYLSLSYLYMIDFALKPEGVLQGKLNEAHNLAFRQKQIEAHQTERKLDAIMTEIGQMTRGDLVKELYDVQTTFNSTPNIRPTQLQVIIENELPAAEFYVDNKMMDLACAVPEFVIGNVLFTYSVPDPIKYILLLYYRLRWPDYFERGPAIPLKRKPIIQLIQNAEEYYAPSFPRLKFKVGILDFDDLTTFGISLLTMVAHADFSI